MSDVSIEGAAGVHEMLGQWMQPKLNKRLQSATKAGATVFKGPVKAEARLVSKRLAKSVSVRQARRDKPATVLTFRPKVAFFRHWILGGTRDHGPKTKKVLVFRQGENVVYARRVRGVPADPIIARVYARYEADAVTAIDTELDKEI